MKVVFCCLLYKLVKKAGRNTSFSRQLPGGAGREHGPERSGGIRSREPLRSRNEVLRKGSFNNSTSVNLTNNRNFTINTIDKITNLCYNEIKLENKTKILTRKTKNKKEQKMAAKKSKNPTTKKAKMNKTHKPKRISWQDELGIGYATYDHEEDYISPATVDEDEENLLRSFNQRLAIAPVFVDDEI